jgi:hypothetical protein
MAGARRGSGGTARAPVRRMSVRPPARRGRQAAHQVDARHDLERGGVRRVERQRAVAQQPVDVVKQRRQCCQVGPHPRFGRSAAVSFDRADVPLHRRADQLRSQRGDRQALGAYDPPPQLRVARNSVAEQPSRDRLQLLLAPPLRLLYAGAQRGIGGEQRRRRPALVERARSAANPGCAGRRA